MIANLPIAVVRALLQETKLWKLKKEIRANENRASFFFYALRKPVVVEQTEGTKNHFALHIATKRKRGRIIAKNRIKSQYF